MTRQVTAAQRLASFCATGSLLLVALTSQTALAQQAAPVNPLPAPAPGQCQAAVPITIKSEWATPRTVFKGWGTSLAWFASTTGTWPDQYRVRIADLLFGQKGLAFNIARYNIGGGRKPNTKPLSRANANIPGMWKMPSGAKGNNWWNPEDPSMWDWDANPGQQWWLSAVKERVPKDQLLLEAASYSPPWFMTISGDVAGAVKKYEQNLRPGFEPQFAEYLVRAMQGLEKKHGVRFTSIAPLNEPNTPYWLAGGHQEGSFFSPAGQSRLLLAMSDALKAHGATARLAAMDETIPQIFVIDWAAYTPQARAVVQQLNVHTYNTTGHTGVRDVASVTKLPLWMSEVDLSAANTVQDFTDPTSALALGDQIVLDLKRLEPEAWVLWQATEPSALPGDPGTNWGLLRTDMSVMRPEDMTIHITAKYYAMGAFSRHVRPGYRLIRNDDHDTITALSPNGRRAVIVHVNHGVYGRKLAITTEGLAGANWKIAAQLVDESAVEPGCDDVSPAVIAPPRAITTVVLDRVDP